MSYSPALAYYLRRKKTRPGGLLAGGGGSSEAAVLLPHANFGGTPFGARFFGANGSYTTDYVAASPIVEGGAGVITYYIDKATGSDSNPGTAAQPIKTIYKAALLNNGANPSAPLLLKVKGGTYLIDEGFAFPFTTNRLAVTSWDGNTITLTSQLTISWALDTGATYVGSLNIAAAPYARNASSAWDGKYPNASGDYAPLIPAASLSACRSTAGTYWVDDPANARIYVHLQDGRAPDADLHVFEANGGPVSFIRTTSADAEIYLEKCHMLGGAAACYLQHQSEVYALKAVLKDCTMKYATQNHLCYASGNVDLAMVNCVGSSSYGDIFSYESYGTGPGPRGLEIGCEARYAGCIGGSANQGSTMHNDGTVVRLNSYYHHNQNDQIADVGTATNSWNIGCHTGPSLDAGYSGYRCGNTTGTKMTLEGCSASGTTYDIISDTGCFVYTHDFTGGATNSGSGTIAALVGVADTTPNAFTFTDVTNAVVLTTYTSNQITVRGINAPAAISIVGGLYSKNGGAYTGSPGTVVTSDTINVRLTTTGSALTAHNATLTIGGVSDTYTVTTNNTPASAPANTVAPAISGTQRQDATLTASTGTWTAVPAATYAYQWHRVVSAASSPITGATSSTYVPTVGDVGNTLFVRVTAANAIGSATADSAATGAIGLPGFSPDAYFGADLKLWVRASDLATITKDGSNNITAWADKGPAGRTLTASGTPTYSATALNGLPGVLCTSGFFSTPAVLSCSKFAVFAVASLSGGSAVYARIISHYDGGSDESGAGLALILRNNANAEVGAYQSGLKSTKALAGFDTPARIGSVFDGVNHTMYVNNVAGTPVAFTAALGGSGDGALIVGAKYTGVQLWQYDPISEIFFVDLSTRGALTSGELADIDAYFVSEWGF